jgi:pimeloyl-ACP methyl ester carboxylesterase
MVDRPATGRFREPGDLEVVDGIVRLDGTALQPVVGLPPTLDAMTGWYDGDGRRVLLAQFPEPYFGEPMVLLGDGLDVRRFYPVSETELIAEDGTEMLLAADRITLTSDAGTSTLTRTERYREQQVTFTAGGTRLAGTLITPAGAGPHPAAVVVHPAAGGQRDFCRLWITPLLEAGVAALIYDKAGCGRSDGEPPSIFDQADAAQAGLDLLATLPDIDVHRVGLVGFSNGMWSVPMVAARRPEVAFIAGIGAPGVSMGGSEVHRRTKVLRDAGVSAETVSHVAAAWQCIFSIVGAGTASPELSNDLSAALRSIELADDLNRYEVPEYVRANPMLSPVPPLMPVADLISFLVAERDPQIGYDPAVDHGQSRCPIFLQYGAHDTSVPVQTSVDRIRAAVPDATILVYPELEHMLSELPVDVVGLTEETAMYGFHRFRFGPTVADDLTAWLRANVTVSSPDSA